MGQMRNSQISVDVYDVTEVAGDHLTSGGVAGFPAGGTSNSFRACWAHDCGEVGWSFDGLTYSAMIGCGFDTQMPHIF